MDFPLAEGLASLLTLLLSVSGAILATRVAARSDRFRDPEAGDWDSWMGRSDGAVDGRPNPAVVFFLTWALLTLFFSLAFDALLVR